MRADRAESLRHLGSVRDLMAQAPISLGEAAKAAYLSPFHFHRLFAEVYGQTPYDFTCDRRIERARQMLVDSNMSISEIALQVGFGTPGSFSSAFRKRTGWTPQEFRNGARHYYSLTGWRTHRFIPSCFLGGISSKPQD